MGVAPGHPICQLRACCVQVLVLEPMLDTFLEGCAMLEEKRSAAEEASTKQASSIELGEVQAESPEEGPNTETASLTEAHGEDMHVPPPPGGHQTGPRNMNPGNDHSCALQ